ncbi:3-hydroxybutyryl-CoA dehydrogenase [Parapedobacter pyrenivorans]|uniref:3-hydroxybutyryl-CoA dehydrogenase n=1 Tax=Parapedobacter pyrenivorans TaxID=1305674 RepID=A0A917M3P9_9SPHI|nr:3-hydroxyacyl-CoA dehydrogenase family protein [Parapedobacter pyrenivorans]GGG73377.1 3-hydroxybutyryl-CoA dehydrogenase [Parapedobacter pyrenivorans]
MTRNKSVANSVLVVGDDKLAYSIATNILAAGQRVTIFAADSTAAHLAVQRDSPQTIHQLDLLTELPDTIPCQLVVAVIAESLAEKKHAIRQLECRIADDTIIAINTDSISLDQLQEGSDVPARILGLNWTYPAHQTYFAEIICNAVSDSRQVDWLEKLAKEKWGKDPYTVRTGFSVRARLFAAMVREAGYLVAHGYATVESVDRACRNDAGYYLPFAGNFRYMDLMGTYAYGMVMKDLNPDLSNATQVPPFMKRLVETGETGMASGKGFYTYSDDGVDYWEKIYRVFSKEIFELMRKYNHEEAIDL